VQLCDTAISQRTTKKAQSFTKQKLALMNENEISQIIIGCAIEVHKQLGPGLLESAYEECLCYELRIRGLNVQKQKPMPIIYK
jgi:hypothetical protein